MLSPSSVTTVFVFNLIKLVCVQDDSLSIALYMSGYWLNTLVLGIVFYVVTFDIDRCSLVSIFANIVTVCDFIHSLFDCIGL